MEAYLKVVFCKIKQYKEQIAIYYIGKGSWGISCGGISRERSKGINMQLSLVEKALNGVDSTAIWLKHQYHSHITQQIQ